MTTPAFTHVDTTKPVVADTRQVGIDAIRTNGIALVYYITAGRSTGWALTIESDASEEPDWRQWAKGTERLRAEYTYASGYITQVVWKWSNDSEVSWATLFTETATYTILTTLNSVQKTGNNSSSQSWLYEWIGKIRATRDALIAHKASAVGTDHTGVGTIASQNADAVAITGGSMKGVTIGGTGAGEATSAKFTAANEKYAGDVTISGSTYTLNLSLGTWFRISPTGNYTIVVSNAPASGWVNKVLLEIVNGVGRTLTMTGSSWGAAGAPTYSANTDFVELLSRDSFSTTRLILKSKG